MHSAPSWPTGKCRRLQAVSVAPLLQSLRMMLLIGLSQSTAVLSLTTVQPFSAAVLFNTTPAPALRRTEKLILMSRTASNNVCRSRILSRVPLLWQGLFSKPQLQGTFIAHPQNCLVDAYNNAAEASPRLRSLWRLCKFGDRGIFLLALADQGAINQFSAP